MGASTPTVMILQHDPAAPAALLGRYLTEAGLLLDVRRVDESGEVPAGLSGADALIVLGGDMNVGEEREYPFLLAERELLSQAVQTGLPTLGICLGAQQLAAAAGGGVVRRDSLAFGWHEIVAHRDDALIEGFDPRTKVFAWRDYACRPPAGAVLIASGDGDPQVFRLGTVAWGVQFHPEVTIEILASWSADDPREVARSFAGGTDALLTESRRRLPASSALCGRLVANFVAACGLTGR